MRGKRAKALRQMATNQWVGALVEHNIDPSQVPKTALVHKPTNQGQAINHPHTLRSIERLTKQSWKRFISNPSRRIA